MTRPDFDIWALGVAESVAVRASCTRRQVGAVILDRDHRVVGAGYNGAPPGMMECTEGACPRGLHYLRPGLSIPECGCGKTWPCPESVEPLAADYDTGPGSCISLHAELNACIDAGRRAAKGGTIYVTCEPCYGCIKVIQATGIRRIAYLGDFGHTVVLNWPFTDNGKVRVAWPVQ